MMVFSIILQYCEAEVGLTAVKQRRLKCHLGEDR